MSKVANKSIEERVEEMGIEDEQKKKAMCQLLADSQEEAETLSDDLSPESNEEGS